MKITQSQLRYLIVEIIATSSGNPTIRQRAATLKQKWDALPIKNTKRPEADPAAKKFLRSLWDKTEHPWAKSKGFTTGGEGDPAEKAWSAATISTIVDDDAVKSIRHSDYRDAAWQRRKRWNAAHDDEKPDIKFVAFKPGEIEPKAGDIRCYKRTGGTHCDICMDDNCKTVVGGNIGDSLTRRSSSSAPKADMYIVSKAKKLKGDSG